MRQGRYLSIALVVLSCCLAPTQAGAIDHSVSTPAEEPEARVLTDGHLRVDHFETIRVKGFPGKGRTEVDFFPTAICGESCGAAARRGTKTNARGAAKFRVRIPGTFFDHKNKRAYFRDGERLDLEVFWYGPERSFAVGGSHPDPILVRTHRSRHG